MKFEDTKKFNTLINKEICRMSHRTYKRVRNKKLRKKLLSIHLYACFNDVLLAYNARYRKDFDLLCARLKRMKDSAMKNELIDIFNIK